MSEREGHRLPDDSGMRAPVDLSTEDGRAFSQVRISLFGKWLFIVTCSLYFVVNVPLDVLMGARVLDWVEEWFGFKEQLTLGVGAVAGILWLSTRGRARSAILLQRIDAIGTVAACGLISGMLLEPNFIVPEMFQVSVVILACTNLVVARAIIIPSTVERTLIVSILAFLPALSLVAYSVFLSPEISMVKAAHTTIAALLWGAIAVASAALTSRILFRLRGQVSRAAQLGHYLLEQEIGRGGMGVVYKARHATLRRPTAIKLLSLDRNHEIDLRRFEREVQCTADLTHANTVAIYDYGRTPSGIFYCAMEFIDGITLRELVDGWGPLPPARVIHILRQVAGALSEAHHEGLIHRDVKPANIMLCERGLVPDVVKVLDFGLVKETISSDGDDEDSESIGAVVGTPAYLSPEAIEDTASVDARSDLYALGAVGYFLLTGKQLYEGKSTVSICVQHLNADPVPPSQRLGTTLPTDLEEIVLSCLKKKPASRPQSSEELISILDSCDDSGLWTNSEASHWWARNRETIAERAQSPVDKTMTIELAGRDDAFPR